MIGFSIFMLFQEKKVASMQYGTYASYISSTVDEILKDNVDDDYKIIDTGQIKWEFVNSIANYTASKTEIAIFTKNYELVFHTRDDLLCSYTKDTDGRKYYTGYAYLNLDDWFEETVVTELKSYYYADTKAKKEGDLAGYSISLESFFVEDEMIIPEKISVIPMYAKDFDKDGRVTSSSGSQQMFYESNYENTKGLKTFYHGAIIPGFGENEINSQLRTMVTDEEKLRLAANKSELGSTEFVNPVTYRFYFAIPYQRHLNLDETDHYYSDFWTVTGVQVNLLEQCLSTLVFVWIISFIVFGIAALLLSTQTYKVYREREEFDQYRRETTNALAHDLKTPLSIISGYAQNLIENIHTEKREYYATNINGNVNRMDKIIREMLELSRYESDVIPLKYDDVSLREVGIKLLERYTQICNEKHITTSLDGDSIVKADFSLLERVMDNFYVNALEQTPEGGVIDISITDHTLEFFNSGSHIPDAVLSEIWKPYKKADTSRSNTKGSGLGLSISSKILDLYHFSYGVKNMANGVVFWFKW
jgi:signal transduction histidine kinase